MEISLPDYMRALSQGGPIYYLPNLGNTGDSLIACATFQLFNKFCVNYAIPNFSKSIFTREVFVYGGGGSLIPYYYDSRYILLQALKLFKRIIILPSTIGGNEDLLSEFGSNVDILCREKVSYEHARKHATRANVYLSHDAAFYLDPCELLSYSKISAFWKLLRDTRTTNDARRLCRLTINDLKIRYIRLDSPKVLKAFRTDREMTGNVIPKGNIDLSTVRIFGVDCKNAFFSTCCILLKCLNSFDYIQTNRLHICIAGILLNKQVMFYPNNYYKNEAVYRYSIEGKYPNVKWAS